MRVFTDPFTEPLDTPINHDQSHGQEASQAKDRLKILLFAKLLLAAGAFLNLVCDGVNFNKDVFIQNTQSYSHQSNFRPMVNCHYSDKGPPNITERNYTGPGFVGIVPIARSMLKIIRWEQFTKVGDEGIHN